MAGKEEENNITELIMTAIETLNEKTGSDKSTIQKHIESNNTTLPVDFSDSISTHLDEMKQNGQLVLVNDKYKKPDSDSALAPPRRGRGRPPKPKPAAKPDVPSDYLAPPARPHGRPPKEIDPLAQPSPPPVVKPATAGGSGRKRGRPSTKVGKPPSVKAPAVVGATGERRGRGRPPKVSSPVVPPVGT